MENFIYKKLERLNKQVSIEKILYYHSKWKNMPNDERLCYNDKFVLYLKKNRIFRDLLILNSLFFHVQKHFDSIFSYYFCKDTTELLFLLLIKINETEMILKETNYALTETEIKKLGFTQRNLEKTKKKIIQFIQDEKTQFLQIFYKGSGETINCIDLLREIYSFLDLKHNFLF